MKFEYENEIDDDSMKCIIEAVNNIPEIDVPDGFRNEVTRAIRVEAALGGKTANKTSISRKISAFTKTLNRRFIYIAASTACIALAFVFIFFSTVTNRMVDSSSQYEPQPAASAAPAAAPDASWEAEVSAEPELGVYDEFDNYSYDTEKQEAYPRFPETESAYSDGDYGDSPDAESAHFESAAGNTVKALNNKLIKTAYYGIEVVDFDKTISEIQYFTEAAGGYVESFSSSVYNEYSGANGRRDLKTGHICLRIPQGGYSSAKISIESLGKVTSTSEDIDNVTGKYVDTAARLEVKKAEEQRLLELFGKAEKIEDLISLESRLTYVRSDIEGMLAQLQNWDSGVTYSTINISITEVIDFSQIKTIDPTLGEKIKEGFNRSMANFTYNVERLIIKTAENSIALLIFIAISTAVLITINILVKRRRGGGTDI